MTTALLLGALAACGGSGDDAAPAFSIAPEAAASASAPASSSTTGPGTSTPVPSTVPASTSPSATSVEAGSSSRVVEPGASTQYTATGKTQVMWGLTQTGGGSSERPVYPLKVSADHRYLEDQNGTPWRVQADAGWMMSARATPQEAEEYLDTRKAQGFNSFYLHLMVHQNGYGAVPNAPQNQAGDPPFATPGDFSTAGTTPESERYWQWIDWIVDQAAQRDMVVMLAYTYLGFGGGDQGWYAEVLAQPSRQALRDWGRWLGNRYKDKPNIIWFGLGDFSPPEGSEGSLRAVAIAEGIKDAGAEQLFMAEPNSPDKIPGEDRDFGPIVDMNSFYGYGPEGNGEVYDTARRAWNDTPTKPAWMQEGSYEFENNSGQFSGNTWDTRRGRFWSVLAGGTAGDGFGSRDAWQWLNFPDSLHTPGAEQSTFAFDLFASMPWWTLRPSGTDPGAAGRDLISEGAGSWGEPDRVVSAVTADGSWLLAYVPVTENGPRTLSVDMSALSGTSRARWFDPATGNYIAIGEGYANQGRQSFTTPGKRGDGTDDWLLVLDTAGSSPCGSITADGQYTAPPSATAGVECEVTATEVGRPDVIQRSPISIGG